MTKRIVACFGEAEKGEAVLEAGRKYAALLGAELVIVHVQTTLTGMTGYYERLFHEELDEIERIFGGPGKDELLTARRYFQGAGQLPHFKLISGDVLAELLKELDNGDYLLAVVGARPDGSLGRTAEGLIRRSPADVLVAKGQPADGRTRSQE